MIIKFNDFCQENDNNFALLNDSHLKERIDDNDVLKKTCLACLNVLGYDSTSLGALFLTDIICVVAKNVDEENLYDNLNNPYSQFYFDIARNEIDIGLKTFHTIISETIKSHNEEKCNTELCDIIFDGLTDKSTFGDQIIAVARYLNKILKSEKKIKRCRLQPNSVNN